MFKRIQEAITVTDRPVLIMVKTRKSQNGIAINRLEHLINDYDSNSRGVLVITYAKWGKNRIIKNLGILGTKKVSFTSTNRICRRILSQEKDNLKIRSVFVDTLREITEKLRIPYRKGIATIIGRLAWIELKNNKNFDVEDYLSVIRNSFSDVSRWVRLAPFKDINNIYSKLIKRIADRSLWYYNDIFVSAINLLDNEEIRNKWRSRIKAIVYDRLVDVRFFEFEIIKRLTEVNRNLFCVGYPKNKVEVGRKFLEYFPDGLILKV